LGRILELCRAEVVAELWGLVEQGPMMMMGSAGAGHVEVDELGRGLEMGDRIPLMNR
jgi:hypothetical protein